MKRLSCGAIVLFVFVPAAGQSVMEFQSGTHIEVTGSADICADDVQINGSYSGDGTQCAGALPVEFLAIGAVAGRNTVTLSWSTASEAFNFGFQVERRMIKRNAELSSDPWAAIAFINGSGTANSPKEYSYQDAGLSPGRYAYRLRQIDLNGSFTYSGSTEVEVGVAPKEFTLSQNYPNPFNPITTIEFTLQQEGHVSLKVYDLTGSELIVLLDEKRGAGYYQSVMFDASRLGSGSYFYRLQAGGNVLTKKMTLVK